MKANYIWVLLPVTYKGFVNPLIDHFDDGIVLLKLELNYFSFLFFI